MTIVRCPRCRDEVSVPAKATTRALVRCPLCLEQYLLAEALANAPPPLIIIGGEVAQDAIEQQAAGEGEYRLSGGVLDASAPAPAAVIMPRPAVRSTPRTRRPEKNGLILVVNYVVGGVLGLSLGLLVLWWGFQQDPLKLGPPIAQYVPWIVPTAFRSETQRSSTNGATARTTGSPTEKNRANQKTTATPESSESSELQTLPGLDEPGRLPGGSAPPAIEAPKLDERGAAERHNQATQASATAADEPTNRPPMPDLRDLLPDN
jgi:hypothetical protein